MGYNGPLTPDYSDLMAPPVQPPPIDLVHTYRMHVAQKYLDLTRQKLELVRLPQAPRNGSRSLELGVSKHQLEPLIDHWLESYNWRRQEDFYNDVLPQFRVPITSTRLHFVHKRSRMPAAVPLLFVHGVPESFISISKMIDMLVDPMSNPTTDGHLTAFNVVVPSIPGMGFSDPVPEPSNNIQSTCDIFDALMKGLGYTQYIAHGSGWGFNIARAIALLHPESCMAVHTVNPEVPPPRYESNLPTRLKRCIAKLTSNLRRRSGFGYNAGGEMSAFSGASPMSLQQPISPNVAVRITPPATPNIAPQGPERPQTAAYALSDSPSGLLAYVYDAIRPISASETLSPEDSRSPESLSGNSPHSPQPYANNNYAASTSGRSTASSSPVATRRSPHASNYSPRKLVPQSSTESTPSHDVSPAGSWTPTALIDWTMLYWLPGPEVALRWLVNSAPLMPTYWASHCMVPLGISHFRDPGSGTGTGQSPPQWAEAYHRVAMVRRREGRVRFPAWEVPAEIVSDLREFVGLLGLAGAAPAPPGV